MKRILANLNSIVAVLLALVLVLMIGFVTLRNPWRIDLSNRNYYELAPKTVNLLKNLDRPVDVKIFFQEDSALYGDIENLLEEYQYHSRHIRLEWIDPARDPARTEKLAAKYGLAETDAQVVVFEIDGKSKKVRQADLAELKAVEGRREPVMTGFKGEQAFSSAIQGLLQEDVPKVYFLVGHGERRVTDFDPMMGYSAIRTVVERDNLAVEELILVSEQEIPSDAAALVIAGPTETMSTVEADMIEGYLARSGRVMVLLDALQDSGLDPMLFRWGVELRKDVVVDPANTLRGNDVHVRSYSDHPISIHMQSIVQFILPRSILPMAAKPEAAMQDRPVVVPLAFSSDKSWGETQLNEPSPKFDEERGDFPGPVSLAVAVERGAPSQLLDVQIKPSRMVVFGDSDFVANGTMVGGNADLFMNALNWLLEREELMAIAPKPIEEVRLTLSRKQLVRLFWLNVVGIPVIAVVAGLLVWLRRRK